MKPTPQTNFTIDRDKATLTVDRDFAAPRALVWRTFTEPALLDRWWAPLPYRTETKHMDFKEGGNWHYMMKGPEGGAHHGLAEYDAISLQESIVSRDTFIDAERVPLPGMPVASMRTVFSDIAGHTHVRITTQYPNLESLETVIKMGMQEGMSAAQVQLDGLLVELG